jgi:putative restriction endonuclease
MLNTDKSHTRWSATTCHRAPHKSFLLLSIMDLIAQGQITENFIEPLFEGKPRAAPKITVFLIR